MAIVVVIQSLSFGGGVQSNAILVAIALGMLERPDVIIIADTGFEIRSTWEYMEAYGLPLARELDIPFLRVSRAGTTLSKKYMSPIVRLNGGGQMVRIPAFIKGTEGRVGKLRNYCTAAWKREVIRWHLTNRFGRKAIFREWIGYSTDELDRARRSSVAMCKGASRWRMRFPLVELKMSRFAAAELVKDYGFPPPPRSACKICPHRTNGEWRDMRDNYPDEFRAAARIERQICRQDNVNDEYTISFHRSGVPLGSAVIDDDDGQGGLGFCDSGSCFT